LLDQNQSPRLGALLAESGHDVVHVRDIDMGRALDTDIVELARNDDRVIVSADTDFGELLARSNAARPSVLLIRRQGQRRAREIAALILANLDDVTEDLQRGAVVVLDADRIRVRALPFQAG
jgi:predicted nuclease of predicted toxin-antitoxin system